ncbi:sigma-70 family RNA polymerase sigma factor [Singulisphaera sp. PoT]|uniref:sigma-70 family RNA polymerase sigma factor n=1 Tax=Singulisphaera sp. PoT TaxID=3411797 RepID=UPI003BF60345
MSSEPACQSQEHIRTLFAAGSTAGMSDRQLLDAFASKGGRASELGFEALVRRHGPMVFRVCRGVLDDVHEADDAFQATFLVLACRAHAIRKPDALGSWLFGVAQRVASNLKGGEARRRLHERQRAEAASTSFEEARDEPWPELYEEIGRLPEKFRVPIVLCYLEGLDAEEAASRLDCAVGTIHSRLSRARERLRLGLTRRGVTLSSGWGISLGAARVSLPEALVASATTFARQTTLKSGTVALLARGVMKSLAFSHLRVVALALIGTLVLGLGLTTALGQRRGEEPTPRQPLAKPTLIAAADPPASKPASPEPKAKPARKRRPDDRRLVPITIHGRALDEAGRPVAGAVIRVTDANRTWRGPTRLLGTTKTDAEGKFRLQEMPLPVWSFPEDPVPKGDEGIFQVSGTADGFGFTWRTTHTYRPAERPMKAPTIETGTLSYLGEPIEQDLRFGPPASIHGKLVDDTGRAMAGVKVQAGYVIDPRRPEGSGMYECIALNPDGSRGADFNGIQELPEEIRSTTTAEDGSYRLDSLPREALFIFQATPDPTYDLISETIVTSTRPVARALSLATDGTFDHTFKAPRLVRLKVDHAESGAPAAGVTVRAFSQKLRMAGAIATTDDEGKATLRLVPAEYQLRLEPPFGMCSLQKEQNLTVAEAPMEQILNTQVDPGAIVEIKAIDRETQAGVEGVRISYVTASDRKPRELQSQVGFVDHVATDGRGVIRAVLPPGPTRFSIKDPSRTYQHSEQMTPMLALAAGTATPVRFVLEKSKEAMKDDSKADPSKQQAQDRRRLHDRLSRHCQFQGRKFSSYMPEIDLDEVRRFLGSLDPERDHDLPALLEARFPGKLLLSTTSYVHAIDGNRSFQSRTDELKPSGHDRSRMFFNAQEAVHYGDSNCQADIYDGLHFGEMSLATYCLAPFDPPRHGGTNETVNVKHHEGRIDASMEIINTIGGVDYHHTQHTLADEKTGFIYCYSHRQVPGGVHSENWQFGPKADPHGLILPSVTLEWRELEGSIDIFEIRRIDRIDFDSPIPPETFVFAAPAGTMVLDHRNEAKSPDSYAGFLTAQVGDVVAYADRRRETKTPRRPLIETGVPAPAIAPASWLDARGETKPLELAGKVVLIDFWGVGCGPCVAQVPRVREAFDYFRDKGLVFLGLHDSSGTPDAVAKFAREHKIEYPLAIDRASADDVSFGATFEAFGVNSIPSAAVLDRQGNVAFVGTFEEALKSAAKLLEAKP